MIKQSDTSIARQLLYWLLLPLGSLWMLSAAITYFMADSYAEELYDDQLMNSADSVIGRLRLGARGVDIDLPPAAVALLRHNFKDKFYFQVISSNGNLITGDKELPTPARLPDQSAPEFGYSYVKNEKVRTVLVEAFVEEAPAKRVFVYSAETLESRKALALHILFNTAISQLIAIVLGALAVWYGVNRGLAPLDSIKRAIAARSQSDLSPIDESQSPLEVRPIVHAINELLERLQEDLLAKQRFVANAAHQLRTPLAGLKTYIGLLKKIVDSPKALELIRQLDSGTDRTTHLVNRLLALAKAEPDALAQSSHRLLDLNEIASETAASLVLAALEKNIELSFEACPQPALVLGDLSSLQELCSNIIENAVFYTPENGKVNVALRKAETFSLIVEDNGPGIPEEERERVFERFYRILGTGVSGSGLGLAIVKEIARSHKARVSLSSGIEGKGTRVTVEFSKLDFPEQKQELEFAEEHLSESLKGKD
ncbi:MAG: sensor histidine kinase N-terminal domain-containing protein [Candidatus Obscuribacterales bacterium]|nr:sensor histidine kinase N-terminal domain-containing protein [Candidatus Obscuribacterales bacterium]